MRSLRLRFSGARALWVAALAPLCILLFLRTRYPWAGPTLVAVGVVMAVVTVRGRWLTGWVVAVCAWLVRRRRPLDAPSEPVVGTTAMPGDHVAVRWQRKHLVAVIELIPRPFTPTVIVDGKAHTDDVVDTALVEKLLAVHCPDLEAEVISAGHRVGNSASPEVVSQYQQALGSTPAPAYRRTWILLRALPQRALKSAQRRDEGVAGLVRYLAASATRIADRLADSGVDAVCGRSFDDFDHATEISFEREKWSTITGRGNVTAAYTAPGGPDAWWSTTADRIITTVRVIPGAAPQSVVLLTTAAKQKAPPGFFKISGGQRAALAGETLIDDHHWQLPIGSAGVLVGETTTRYPVYLPLDDVDTSLSLGDARVFAQFAVRAAAAGGLVTLGPQFREFAELIGARVGPEASVAWPGATTYLGRRPGHPRVTLRHNVIATPRHRQLPIRPIPLPDEGRYQRALPAGREASIPERSGPPVPAGGS